MNDSLWPRLLAWVVEVIGIMWYDDMKKNATFGTAIWITSDGDFVRAENHLEQLVIDNFDLDLFKEKLTEYIRERYVNEADILAMEEEGRPYNPNEPGAPQPYSEGLIEISDLIDDITPLQIGVIPVIISKLRQLGENDFADAVEELIPFVCQEGFEDVIFGNEQPYHYAFKRGDIRVRLFPNSFVTELNAQNLNRETGDQIVNALFKLTGGNPSNMPSEFGIDLVNFSGKEPVTKGYMYRTMDEFFNGLMQLTKMPLARRAARIHTILRLARVFYQRVMER